MIDVTRFGAENFAFVVVVICVLEGTENCFLVEVVSRFFGTENRFVSVLRKVDVDSVNKDEEEGVLSRRSTERSSSSHQKSSTTSSIGDGDRVLELSLSIDKSTDPFFLLDDDDVSFFTILCVLFVSSSI